MCLRVCVREHAQTCAGAGTDAHDAVSVREEVRTRVGSGI